MTVRDDFRWWHLALQGIAPDPVDDHPEPGFYKMAKGKDEPAVAVAIWSEHGRLVARVGMQFEEPGPIWNRACRSPISYEDYVHWRTTGAWKDHPATADGVLTRDLAKAAPIY